MIRETDNFNAHSLLAAKAESLAAAKNAAPGEKQRAAQEFVAMLFMEVLKAMRASIPKGGLFESDSVENDIYTSMSDTEVARAIAGREALGLRKLIENALDKSAARGIERAVPQTAERHSALTPPDLRAAPEQRHDNEIVPPAAGSVSSKFGLRADPWTGESRLHRGVDIAAASGSAVKSVAGGRVVFSGWLEGYGNLVAIDHGDGIVSRYGHNEINLVQNGDEVAAGQEIALVGATGRATGPHLHFEVLRDGRPVDPMQAAGFHGVFKGTKKG